MATMDTEPIPTEPTTDPEPPVATPVVPGPSLASASPAAGRGRGPALRRAAIGLALVLTFSVGIGVGRLDLPALGGFGTTTPAPTTRRRRTSASSRRPGTSCTASTSAPTQLNDRDLIYGAINGMTEAVGDTGHTSFLTPEERAQRANDLSGKYVGIGVRIDTAADGLPLVVGVFNGSPAEKAGDGRRRRDRRGRRQGRHRQRDRRCRRLGPRRSRHDRRRHGPDRRDRAGAEADDGPRRGRRPARHLDDRARDEDGADPARPVLDRCRGRPQGGPRRRQEGRRGPDHPRPARQSGRLRQRGRRRSPASSSRTATSTSRRRPTATRPRPPSRPVGSPPTCRWWSSSTPARPARPRS